MGIIAPIKIPVTRCTGANLRWYFNGWHHYTFNNRYRIIDTPTTTDTQVQEEFSAISRVEIPTGKENKREIEFGEQGMQSDIFEGMKGLMLAEVAQILINGFWLDLDVARTNYKVRTNDQNAYDVEFKSEIKSGVDIVTQGLVFENEPIVLYYENFEGDAPWGFTIKSNEPLDNIEKVDGNKMRINCVAGSTTRSVYVVHFLENYAEIYGNLKITIEYAAIVPTQNIIDNLLNYGYYYDYYLNLVLPTAFAEGYIYAHYKKTRVIQYQLNAETPLKNIGLEIYVSGGNAANIDVNYIKIEKL